MTHWLYLPRLQSTCYVYAITGPTWTQWLLVVPRKQKAAAGEGEVVAVQEYPTEWEEDEKELPLGLTLIIQNCLVTGLAGGGKEGPEENMNMERSCQTINARDSPLLNMCKTRKHSSGFPQPIHLHLVEIPELHNRRKGTWMPLSMPAAYYETCSQYQQWCIMAAPFRILSITSTSWERASSDATELSSK